MSPPTQMMHAWLHFYTTDASLRQSDVDAALRRVGVITEPLNLDRPYGCGVLFFSEVTSSLCKFIHTFSRNGLERLLAIAVSSATLANGSAWQLLQAGAADVFAWDALPDPAAVAVARLRRWQEVDELLASPMVQDYLVSNSRAWKAVLREIVEAARFTDSAILLTGETGTGKELVAKLIHRLDAKRSKHEQVVLDCTTIAPELAGSELFGHERGAFTGAVAARDGAFALANSGTLFLDEVGELPLGLQAQLLRAVQERTYKRVGSNVWRTTDFRLVCATNRNLLQEEAHGQFRRDLYYRIAGWTFKLPPLRERTEDIILLAQHFMCQICPNREPPTLDPPVQEYLLLHSYPGNVRDLRNLTHRIMHRHVGPGPITLGDIPADERLNGTPDPDDWQSSAFEQAIRRAFVGGAGLKEIRHAAEDAAIRIALGDEDGNLQRAARRLGVTDRALQLRRAEQRQQILSTFESA